MKLQSRRSLQFSDLMWGPQSPHTPADILPIIAPATSTLHSPSLSRRKKKIISKLRFFYFLKVK